VNSFFSMVLFVFILLSSVFVFDLQLGKVNSILSGFFNLIFIPSLYLKNIKIKSGKLDMGLGLDYR
jgi:hypothetical protein